MTLPSRSPRSWLPASVALLCLGGTLAVAQELRVKQTPLSAWLDLRPAAPGSAAQTAPDWVEDFEYVAAKPAARQGSFTHLEFGSAGEALTTTGTDKSADVGDDGRARAVFRIRLHRPVQAGADTSDLEARVFFDDRVGGPRPRVTAWDELGNQLLRSRPLGAGLGLPSSETVRVPMTGVNYLEIDAAEDGEQVRGVFLTWLKAGAVLQAADFASAKPMTEPFHILAARHASAAGKDTYLYGVVTASLQKEPALLSAAGTSLDFELEHAPLVAVLTCEVLGADISAPPNVTVNGTLVGPCALYLPDLADPGYQGEARDDKAELNFHYTGWLRAQIVVPGGSLTAGSNRVALALSNNAEPLAVRSIEVQLKYNWEKFDYFLSPAAANQ